MMTAGKFPSSHFFCASTVAISASMSPAVMGCNATDHNVYAANLLPWYAPANGRTVGEDRVEPTPPGRAHANGWLVTHASETLHQGRPVRFVAVLVPHPRSVSGKGLGESIVITQQDGNTKVSLNHRRDAVHVTSSRQPISHAPPRAWRSR